MWAGKWMEGTVGRCGRVRVGGLIGECGWVTGWKGGYVDVGG